MAQEIILLPVPIGARRLLEDAIERLIAILDEYDGEPDLEDCGDDEPWLAGLPHYPRPGALDLEEEETDDDRDGIYDLPGHLRGGQGL